jgi:hypothetical protein
MRSNRRLGWALLLSLGLLALWGWRARLGARRSAEAALFMAYVDGPLHDYALSATRGLPQVKGARGDWNEAAQAGAASSAGLTPLLQQARPGWIRSRLEFVAPLHERWAAMLASRPNTPAAKKSWLAEEKELRGKLVYTLEDVRYESFKIWRLPKERFLELNALIYSLKELDN